MSPQNGGFIRAKLTRPRNFCYKNNIRNIQNGGFIRAKSGPLIRHQARILYLLILWSHLKPKLTQSWLTAEPTLSHSWADVESKLSRSWAEVKPKLSHSWADVEPKRSRCLLIPTLPLSNKRIISLKSFSFIRRWVSAWNLPWSSILTASSLH